MIQQAVSEYNLDLKQSILIGDNITDIQAGLNAGVQTNIYINNQPLSSEWEARCHRVTTLQHAHTHL